MNTVNPPFGVAERMLLCGLAGVLLLASPMAARSADAMKMDSISDPHAHHHQMVMDMNRVVVKSEVNYSVPDVTFVREDGARVRLKAELGDGKPVFLNFIFTTCTTVCPVLSRTFSMVQDKLGEDAGRVHLVSITIDPEQDTPARLAAYARRFKAGPEWHFYTGTTQASIAAQKAFNTFRGDKMDHQPVTLFRPAPGKPWVRFDGFATADEVVREYHQMRPEETAYGMKTTCSGGGC